MAINNAVYEALKKCQGDSFEVIQADLDFFYPGTKGDRVSAFKQVVETFGTDENIKL